MKRRVGVLKHNRELQQLRMEDVLARRTKSRSFVQDISSEIDYASVSPVKEIEYNQVLSCRTRKDFCGNTEINWGGTANF